MNFRYALLLIVLLAGCDQLGIETPAQQAARSEAEGKAIGSACRQSGRALEDCYQMNSKVPKAAIFDGWREMDGYMRENKISDAVPQSLGKLSAGKHKSPEPAEEPAASPHAGAENKDAAPAAAGKDEKPAESTPAAKPATSTAAAGKHAT
jgi:hypothetical protein